VKRASTLVLFVIVIFFVVVFVAFYGVKNSLRSGHIPTKQTTTLTFMNSWGGYDSKAAVIDDILNNFQDKNPGVTVVNQTLSGDDFLPAIKEKFSTGEQPDVFGLWPGSDIRSLIAAGKVADLTQVINSDPVWKKSFTGGMWKNVIQNGKIYGLPVEITFEGLFINKKLFSEYHVPVPKDYNGLIKAIKIFKANNITPIAFNCKPEGSYLYQNIAMSLGGKAVEKPFAGGKINKCYIDAMYIMRNLYAMGAFPSNDRCFTMESNERDDLFTKKKAAMIVQGSWFIEKCTDTDFALVAFPRMSAKSQNNVVYELGCGTFYISEKAWKDPAKRKQAIKLLKYITSKDSCTMLAKKTDMVSNVDLSGEHIKYGSLTQVGLSLIKNAKNRVGAPDSYFTRSVWESVIIKNFPDMLHGNISPEQLWQEAVAKGAEEK
jgi:raffinose/stachyose/melibiose transport system substrate-binding protein